MNEQPTVLVVDDDASSRAMLSLSLRRAGFLTVSAASGKEALELLRSSPVEFLVTDGKMAPMDGFELSRRAKDIVPELHIAMVSAVYGECDADGSPVERVFEKPVAVESLVSWMAAA